MRSNFTTRRRSRHPSRRPALPRGSRLIVIGNGMVGCRFCEALVELGLHQHLAITVIGAENQPAYDRIKLSSYVDHRSATRLILKDAAWYAAHAIDLRLGASVDAVDRQWKNVTLSTGDVLPYDFLVFATGSRPFLPPIAGADLPGVHVYRTLADLDRIISAAEGKHSAVVIGGGLLGLEAAQAVAKLGLHAIVVERARHLMPQQLNEAAAAILQHNVEAQRIRLVLGCSSTTIHSSGDHLRLEFDGDRDLETDLVIVSAGIQPNSELADDAGLAVGARGGITVNAHLETEDPAVFAIGECALLHGRVWGLAAPGYAMARHLAARLAGQRVAPLPEPDLSTRLKMLGADVVTIGSPLEEGTRHEFRDESRYRLLLTGRGGELLGALGVGPWPEDGRVRSLYEEGARLRPTEIEHFLATGDLILSGSLSRVAEWPDHRVVCNCTGATKGRLVACLARCGRDPSKLAEETGASTVCGSCRPLVEELCGGESSAPARPVAARALMTASVLGLILVLLALLAPPLPAADSVVSWRFRLEQLWRDNFLKQVTGYSLAAVFTVGLLFSLRKRLRWFRIGHFARWRAFHAWFGVLSLAALFAHTGFRFGHNLNFWLMLCFVALNLLGAAAGMVAAVESRGTSSAALAARRFRPALVWAHVVLFWPLPVLLVFHVLSVYLY